MKHQLRSRLLKIGRAAGARSESGGIRFSALLLATLTLALSLAALVTALAAQSSRADNMASGHLVTADSSTPSASTVQVKFAIDHLRDGRQYTVVYISPGGSDAPLPPGLDRWPEPGTAVLSPELLREGAGEDVSERYGETVDTIDESGLADATELLVYVRPTQDFNSESDPEVISVSGFGGFSEVIPYQNIHWLLANQDSFEWSFPALLIALGVVPSMLLALVASRVASHSRDRRDALIITLGGRAPHRLWVAAGEAWMPVSLGALSATALIAWFALADRRIPLVDYVVSAADLRSQWWLLGLCPIAAAAFVLCAAVLQSALGELAMSGNRPLRQLGRRTRSLRTTLFPCFVLLAALGPNLFSPRSSWYLLSGYIGLIGIALTMPSAISVGVAAAGRVLARSGRRSHRPSFITAGKRMSFSPGALARQVFGVSSCILLLLFTLTMQGNYAGYATEADAYIDEHGYSLMEVHPRGQTDASEVGDFIAAVPDGIEVVSYVQFQEETVDPSDSSSTVTVIGDCPALESLGLPCPAEGQEAEVDVPDGAFAEWFDRTQSQSLTVMSGDPASALTEGSISLLAFTTDGDDIGAGVLNNAGTVFQFGVSTSVPGESWYVGAIPPLEQAGWVTLIGGFGLIVLVLATGVGLAGEFLRFGRVIAPLSVLTGNRRIYWRASALISMLPLAIAVIGGFGIGYAAVRPLTNPGVDLITPTFVIICCAAAFVAGLAMWVWSASAAVRSADRWRPGRGDD